MSDGQTHGLRSEAGPRSKPRCLASVEGIQCHRIAVPRTIGQASGAFCEVHQAEVPETRPEDVVPTARFVGPRRKHQCAVPACAGWATKAGGICPDCYVADQRARYSEPSVAPSEHAVQRAAAKVLDLAEDLMAELERPGLPEKVRAILRALQSEAAKAGGVLEALAEGTVS